MPAAARMPRIAHTTLTASEHTSVSDMRASPHADDDAAGPGVETAPHEHRPRTGPCVPRPRAGRPRERRAVQPRLLESVAGPRGPGRGSRAAGREPCPRVGADP